MSERKHSGKITLGMLKGKSMTTSVPSIAIRFHANAEQIEELYASDDDQGDHNKSDKPVTSTPNSSATTSETESSPLRSYFPKKLVKRSTSIDAGPLTVSDSSPPSDPWRFFSNLTGKITKSVEDKLTEIKTRNQEEISPQHKPVNKDSKESSLSDSEDISESSISKTCGIVSTTEGVEMSSDDETPSIEKDRKIDKNDAIRESKSDITRKSSGASVLSRRFRLMKNKTLKKEGNFSAGTLAKLYALKTGIEPALADENSEEVESGVEALEEVAKVHGDKNVENGDDVSIQDLHTNREHISNEIINRIVEDIDNIDIDDEGVITVHEVDGIDIKSAQVDSVSSRSFFAPTGFVDLRPHRSPLLIYWKYAIVVIISVIYYFLQKYSTYLAGVILGLLLSWTYSIVMKKFFPTPSETLIQAMSKSKAFMEEQRVFEIPAIKEYEPINKFEGWANELPNDYDPHSYHITQTQSVYLKLQSYMLRISHTKTKIPKRALWNEPEFRPVFTQHRIYNLLGAKVMLLPEGLTKKRQWSKKYPICIVLPKDQLNFEYPSDYKVDTADDKENEAPIIDNNNRKVSFGIRKRRSHEVQSQRFSKLTEEEEDYDLESETSRPSSPSPASDENGMLIDMDDMSEEQIEDDVVSLEDDEWTTFTPSESPTETVIYLFGRTDREKEDWYRRLAAATHIKCFDNSNNDSSSNVESSSLLSIVNTTKTEMDYLKYMAQFQKVRSMFKKKHEKTTEDDVIVKVEREISVDVLWVNALLGRILYDCMNDPSFTLRVKERIQRKLSAIKLPYFIEVLTLTELSLGNSPPLVQKVERPLINQRGLWIDLKITYNGLVVLYVLTKLNLMRLKQPHEDNQNDPEEKKSAIFNSDVDDTAESSTDDDTPHFHNSVLDSSGNPLPGVGGTSNKSKRLIKMVDKIAESKFFKAATEIGYIKKAMEEVSNTELKLKVELKSLSGTLVLNIPPPPSDRIWIGFRPIPELLLSAHPIVGERNITMMSITSWIEKKLLLEFQKLLVIPNMEDIMIPVMNHNLPE